MTNEEVMAHGFVPIKEYEDYLVNSKGMIFSKKRNKLLSLTKGNSGYLHVTLRNKNGAKSFRVHRLMAEAFIPNPYRLPMVNHKDESRDNNNADNLEWKVYYKPYIFDLSLTKYFRTHFGAKRFYRKMHKECKWIYMIRLKRGTK